MSGTETMTPPGSDGMSGTLPGHPTAVGRNTTRREDTERRRRPRRCILLFIPFRGKKRMRGEYGSVATSDSHSALLKIRIFERCGDLAEQRWWVGDLFCWLVGFRQ
ncbi:uncharacterized [Tachysurus ichikawai]